MIGATPPKCTYSHCSTPERDAGRHAGVDRVAAGFQDFESGLRGEIVGRRHHVPVPKMRGWCVGMRCWSAMRSVLLCDAVGVMSAARMWPSLRGVWWMRGRHRLDIELVVQRHRGVVAHLDIRRLDQQFFARIARPSWSAPVPAPRRIPDCCSRRG